MKTKQTFTGTVLFTALFILTVTFLSSCGEDSISTSSNNNNGNNGTTSNVSLSVKTDNGATDASLIITEAKALITEVEAEQEPSGTSEHIRIAPFVIHFDMSGNIISTTSGEIPRGQYNKIKFKIHKPEDNEPIPDPEFREGSSGNQRYSFIIKGTFNGNSFVFKSRKSANLVINLASSTNIQVGSANFTLIVNPLTWFNNGTLDPNNSGNENEIDDHLKNSFKRAFRDDDRNGLPDDN
jgi:hypothetical protein